MMEQILNFFIPNAYADATTAAPAQGGLSFIMMFAIFFIFLYFVILRPQNKRAKEQQNLLNSLAKGDEIMTVGGIMGRISKISDQFITLTIAPNVDIHVQKSSVISILPKGTLKSME